MLKYEPLTWLADVSNIAQYACIVSTDVLERDTRERQYVDNENCTVVSTRIRNFTSSESYKTDRDKLTDIVEALKSSSPAGAVSIRTFTESKPSGNPFSYNCTSTYIAVEQIINWIQAKYYVIVNETIPIIKNSINGVIYDDTISFTLGATPRFVDDNTKDKEPVYPLHIGLSILKILYGKDVDFSIVPERGYRVEFTIYPKKIGYNNNHLVIWEYTKLHKDQHPVTPSYNDVNTLSKYIGNKAYGILLASIFGMRVPKSVLYFYDSPDKIDFHTWTNRKEYITFGCTSNRDVNGSNKSKIRVRTCPKYNKPGLYSTLLLDRSKTVSLPHAVREFMYKENLQTGDALASCVLEHNLDSRYSGTVLCKVYPDKKKYDLRVECVRGDGESYMLGDDTSFTTIPKWVRTQIENQCILLNNYLDYKIDVKLEWVATKYKVYIVQMQFTNIAEDTTVIYSGDMKNAVVFDASLGLDALTMFIDNMLRDKGKIVPVILKGKVGIGSHLVDVLRVNHIPSVLKL